MSPISRRELLTYFALAPTLPRFFVQSAQAAQKFVQHFILDGAVLQLPDQAFDLLTHYGFRHFITPPLNFISKLPSSL